MKVGILILAAGRSARFGSDKRVARLPDGQRIIDATVTNARASGLPLLVCLGMHDHQLAADLVAPGITCLQCLQRLSAIKSFAKYQPVYLPGDTNFLL